MLRPLPSFASTSAHSSPPRERSSIEQAGSIRLEDRSRDLSRMVPIIRRQRSVNDQLTEVFFHLLDPGTRRAIEHAHQVVAVQRAYETLKLRLLLKASKM